MRRNRALRLHGLLKHLGVRPRDEQLYGLDPDERRSLGNRSVRRTELIEICESLGIDTDGTKPELRNRIRKELDIGRKRGKFGIRSENQPLKEGRTRFSASELRTISYRYEHSLYLEVDDVEIDVYANSPVARINGEEFDVTQIARGPALDEWDAAYDRYVGVYLDDDRLRVMLLHGLDTNACVYDHSVVLEEARDYGPYMHWKKTSYVRELEIE